MNRLKIAKERGWTYNPETGEVRTPKGILPKGRKIQKHQTYINCGIVIDGKTYSFTAHRFAWFFMTSEVPNIVEHSIHHQDPIYNNRFNNLSNGTSTSNNEKKTCKGYTKCRNKFVVRLVSNYKHIYIGRYDTAEEARFAYLEAKKIYHIH